MKLAMKTNHIKDEIFYSNLYNKKIPKQKTLKNNLLMLTNTTIFLLELLFCLEYNNMI
jgi:hypothetical protein